MLAAILICRASDFVDDPIFPVLPSTYGHSALILQNPSFVTDFFRNFGFAEVTGTRKSKRKTSFPFAFLSFFRNFAA